MTHTPDYSRCISRFVEVGVEIKKIDDIRVPHATGTIKAVHAVSLLTPDELATAQKYGSKNGESHFYINPR
jgi:hypothetical protein